MRAVSPKRARLNRQYRNAAREFLEAHPRCEHPLPCYNRATDVHHRRGRLGALLLDETHWTALCRPCHRWITEHPAEAYEWGISERRIGEAS